MIIVYFLTFIVCAYVKSSQVSKVWNGRVCVCVTLSNFNPHWYSFDRNNTVETIIVDRNRIDFFFFRLTVLRAKYSVSALEIKLPNDYEEKKI